MALKTFKYEARDKDGKDYELTVIEHSESIANAEAAHELRKQVNPTNLVAFNLVCVGQCG